MLPKIPNQLRPQQRQTRSPRRTKRKFNIEKKNTMITNEFKGWLFSFWMWRQSIFICLSFFCVAMIFLCWGSFQHAFFGSSYKWYNLGMFCILHYWFDGWTYPHFELSFKTQQSRTGHFHILLEFIKLGLRSLSNRSFSFRTYKTNKSDMIFTTLWKTLSTTTCCWPHN